MSDRFVVVFAIYPGITQLDFTGPYEVLSRLPRAQCIVASTTGEPITVTGGLTFGNVRQIADVTDCTLLCVPGGYGTVQALNDTVFLEHLQRLATSARYVTSVCTGSLLLGAAGLLNGRQAACHWAWRDGLAAFGARPDSARVVRDGNIFTGGGVTAGIDMALTVMAEVAGDAYAKAVQLAIEYAPQPPFNSGRPEDAEPDVIAAVVARFDAIRPRRDAAISAASARLRLAPAN